MKPATSEHCHLCSSFSPHRLCNYLTGDPLPGQTLSSASPTLRSETFSCSFHVTEPSGFQPGFDGCCTGQDTARCPPSLYSPPSALVNLKTTPQAPPLTAQVSQFHQQQPISSSADCSLVEPPLPCIQPVPLSPFSVTTLLDTQVAPCSTHKVVLLL